MAIENPASQGTSDHVRIFDTTLRDGEQSPGCTMNVEEKIAIARQLDRLNVDVIEAGFAASSPGDFDSVRRVAQAHLAEVTRLVDAYLTVKDSLEPLPAQELLNRARDGLVTVIDVRPVEEYAAGHVAGALSVPLAELEKDLSRLPQGQAVVAYCRGPYCVLAYEAVARLRGQGFVARRLENGYPEWKQAGLPVEEGGGPSPGGTGR